MFKYLLHRRRLWILAALEDRQLAALRVELDEVGRGHDLVERVHAVGGQVDRTHGLEALRLGEAAQRLHVRFEQGCLARLAREVQLGCAARLVAEGAGMEDRPIVGAQLGELSLDGLEAEALEEALVLELGPLGLEPSHGPHVDERQTTTGRQGLQPPADYSSRHARVRYIVK